ncbi:MAG: toprim domain-containing protein [Nitrososphaerales archaeon]
MIDKRRKIIDAFGTFVSGFVHDLNQLSEEGWSILVEGQRDEKALRRLGYGGRLASLSAVRRRGTAAFEDSRKVVILTDLDKEGAALASRCLKALTHEGISASLTERRRLKHASRGVFLHIENLSRFADSPN